VEADTILAAVKKAKQSEAYAQLTEQERSYIHKVENELILAYHHDYYHLIRAKIDELNQATLKLAENMMNTAVSGALRGTKV
jgi:hypothetical protein